MPTKTGKPSACLSSGRIIHIISGRLSLPDLNSWWWRIGGIADWYALSRILRLHRRNAMAIEALLNRPMERKVRALLLISWDGRNDRLKHSPGVLNCISGVNRAYRTFRFIFKRLRLLQQQARCGYCEFGSWAGPHGMQPGRHFEFCEGYQQ